MATYKEQLKKNTDYLRGLQYADDNLKRRWLERNLSTLQTARDRLNRDLFKEFTDRLYKYQLWQGLETDKWESGFRPDQQYVDSYLKGLTDEIDFTLKYRPDTDEQGNIISDGKGYTMDLWNFYGSLDDKGKEDFRLNVRTLEELQKEADMMSYNQFMSSSDTQAAGSGFLGALVGKLFLDDKENMYRTEYWEGRGSEENLSIAAESNKERMDLVWSRYMARYIESPQYKQVYDTALQGISNNWDKAVREGNDLLPDEEFLQAIKYRPEEGEGNALLTRSSGTDATSMEKTEDTSLPYETLLRERPEFKQEYMAHLATLTAMVLRGEITNADKQKALEDIAANALKDKETTGTRVKNALRGAYNQGITYSVHKAALFANAFAVDDSDVFIDALGNVYPTDQVNSHGNVSTTRTKDEQGNETETISGMLYVTPDGESINYKKDGNKIWHTEEGDFIYKNSDGSYLTREQVESLGDNSTDGIKAVPIKSIPIKKVRMHGFDLARMGKDENGKEIDAWYNERYLSLAEKYNDSFLNREKLDYWDKYGSSPYNNIIRPGTDGRDFWGETARMMGFVWADMAQLLTLRAVGGFGSFGNALNTSLQVAGGLISAGGIADSYAQQVFEENLTKNKERIWENLSLETLQSAKKWLNSEEGAKVFNSELLKAIESQESELGRKLSEEERILVAQAVRQKVTENLAKKNYNAEASNSEKLFNLQQRAVKTAGDAALADLYTEGIKYGIVNSVGFRSWMFKTRGALEAAASANVRTLFGKNLDRIKKATAADVAASAKANGGKALFKEGDVIVDKAFQNMSRGQKALRILGATGKQAWGGAWTNWTDEMQSAGAKAQNDLAFTASLRDPNGEGTYGVANLFFEHLRGAAASTLEENSLWAGLVGGAGTIFGLGLNANALIESASNGFKSVREAGKDKKGFSKFMSKTGALAETLFTNGILQEYTLAKYNDLQALSILDRGNKIVLSLQNGNLANMAALLLSGSKIGQSFNEVEQGENDIIHVFNTLKAIDSFSKSNPGLAELDGYSQLQDFKRQLNDLAGFENLAPQQQQEYVEKLKAENPHMTNQQVQEELVKVKDRANMMLDIMGRWEKTTLSKEYQKAIKRGDQATVSRLESIAELEALNDYLMRTIEETESKMGTLLNHKRTDNSATYAQTKRGAKDVMDSYELLQKHYQESRDRVQQRKEEVLKKLEAVKKVYDSETSTEQLKNLAKADIERYSQDLAFYEYNILKYDERIENFEELKQSLKEKLDLGAFDKSRLISADEILAMNPIDRLRMLNPDNLSNYSKRQQKIIKDVLADLALKGITQKDIQNQAIAYSRWQDRDEVLKDTYNRELTSISALTELENSITASRNIQLAQAIGLAKSKLKEVENQFSNPEEQLTAKKMYLKLYQPEVLEFMKGRVSKDDAAIIDEILPLARTASLVYDIVENDEVTLRTDADGNPVPLEKSEKDNLLNVIKDAAMLSSSEQEFMENLADQAITQQLPSISAVLDRVADVYATQHATVIETAKEKAERLAEMRELAAKQALDENQAQPLGQGQGLSQTLTQPLALTTIKDSKGNDLKVGDTIIDSLGRKSTILEINDKGIVATNEKGNIFYNQKEYNDITNSKVEKAEQTEQNTKPIDSDYKGNKLEVGDTIKASTGALGTIIGYGEKGTAQENYLKVLWADRVTLLSPRMILDYQIEKVFPTSAPAPVLPVKLDTSALNEKQLKALNAINLLISDTQRLVLPASLRDPHADHYLVNGLKYMRVHGAMGNTFIWLTGDKTNRDQSLKNGSIVDGIVRDFFNGALIEKPGEFSQGAFDQLIQSLEEIKKTIDERGEIFLANNIIVYHEFPNGVRVAGELDILSVRLDENGNATFAIYDLKTSAGDRETVDGKKVQTGKAFKDSKYWETSDDPTRLSVVGTRESYTNQVSFYNLLFNRMTGFDVRSMGLLPYLLRYDDNGQVIGVIKHLGIRIKYNSDVERMVAYQPAVLNALNRINKEFQGVFTQEQLNTMKGIILNGLVTGLPFKGDMATFFDRNQLQGVFTRVDNGVQKFNQIIKELVQEVKSIDVGLISNENTPAPNLDIEEALQEPKQIGETPVEQLDGAGVDSIDVPQSPLNATLDDTDVAPLDSAERIKGNVMDPYLFEDKETRQAMRDEKPVPEEKLGKMNGVLRRKYQIGDGGTMDKFHQWMESRGINIPEVVDLELNAIMKTGTSDKPVKLMFMRVNSKPNPQHNEYMDKHTLIVVEYTDAVKKVHNEEYGKPIEFNGKQYIIIGTLGYSGSLQFEQSNKIAQSVRSKAVNYFLNNEKQEFFVDESAYTHVASVHSGFIITRMLGDDSKVDRNLSELISSTDGRNPYNETMMSLKFGIQTLNGFRVVRGNSSETYHWPINYASNVGNVFVMIKGANGEYYPAMIKPARYNEISLGSLYNRIQQSLRKLQSSRFADRKAARQELASMLVLHRADQAKDEGIDIIVGNESTNLVSIKKDGVTILSGVPGVQITALSLELALNTVNPRININESHLTNETRMNELDLAGALKTDLARLAKGGADYSVYPVGTDGKPIIPKQALPEFVTPASPLRRPDRTIYQDLTSYTKNTDGTFSDSAGHRVTDTDVINSLLLNDYLIKNGLVPYTKGAKDEYFVINNDINNPIVIHRDANSKRAEYMLANEAVGIINEINERARKQAEALRDKNAQGALDLTKLPPVPPEPIKPTALPEDNGGSSFLDLLDMDRKDKQPALTPQSEKPTAPLQDADRIKNNLLNNLDNSNNSSNFATHTAKSLLLNSKYRKTILEAAKAVWPEASSIKSPSQMVEFLKSKGKMTEGIKDIDAWIDNFKCP